jgi:predicted DNA-binding transcriptional regulator AlpA
MLSVPDDMEIDMTEAHEIFDVTQAAAHLRMSTRTLQRLAAKGSGPRRIRVSMARIIYMRADLDAWRATTATLRSAAA